MKNITVKSFLAACLMYPAVFSGCSDSPKPDGRDLPVKVKIESVKESTIEEIFSYVGTIEEISSTALSFSSLGMIEKIFVSEGDHVSKGRLLAGLDPSSAQSLFSAAEASLKQARDAYDRLKSVYDKGSLTEIQMVDIETRLHQAQSSHDLAKKNLENCNLYAPAGGVIGKRMAEAGEYSVIGKAILILFDISSVKVRFSVPENEIAAIPSDCRSIITVSALGDKKFYGTRIIKNVVANPVSHSYPVHIILSNPGRELLPGMICRVELIPDVKTQAIVVPIGAIQTTTDGRKFIWSDSGGLAKRSFVTTGEAKGNGVEITAGLSAGDRIITGGYQKISEEDKITGQ